LRGAAYCGSQRARQRGERSARPKGKRPMLRNGWCGPSWTHRLIASTSGACAATGRTRGARASGEPTQLALVQPLGEGHVKAPLIEDVGIVPEPQQRLLAAAHPAAAAAGKLLWRWRGAEGVERAHAGGSETGGFRAAGDRAQGEKAIKFPQTQPRKTESSPTGCEDPRPMEQVPFGPAARQGKGWLQGGMEAIHRRLDGHLRQSLQYGSRDTRRAARPGPRMEPKGSERTERGSSGRREIDRIPFSALPARSGDVGHGQLEPTRGAGRSGRRTRIGQKRRRARLRHCLRSGGGWHACWHGHWHGHCEH
jgi:hypothetical protein